MILHRNDIDSTYGHMMALRLAATAEYITLELFSRPLSETHQHGQCERFLRTIEGFLTAKKDGLSVVQTICPCAKQVRKLCTGAVATS